MTAEAETMTNWNNWVANHPACSLLQTTEWGRLKAEFGWQWELVTLQAGSEIQGGAVILYRSLPLRAGVIAYVPRGPVVDWTQPQIVEEVMELVIKAARQRRAWALWVEPEAMQTSDAETRLRQLGFSPSARTVQPPRTIFIDLTLSDEQILAQMKSKTRYNIRLAERKGVTVRAGTAADVGTFHELMQETGARDEFGIHSEAYYRTALELFSTDERITLFLAEVEGEVVAGLLAFAVGSKAWYVAGASSNRHREKMPTYALQWTAIQWAKAKGCTLYDLWGIPDADEAELEAQFAQRDDGLWGVYRFKRGFGGQIVRYCGLWEKALHPLYPFAARFYRG